MSMPRPAADEGLARLGVDAGLCPVLAGLACLAEEVAVGMAGVVEADVFNRMRIGLRWNGGLDYGGV